MDLKARAFELIGASETARYFRQEAYDRARKRDILSKDRQHWAASCADANRLLSRDRNGGTKLFNGSSALTESGRSLNSRGIHIWHVLLAKSGNISGFRSLARRKERQCSTIRLVFQPATLTTKKYRAFFCSSDKSSAKRFLSKIKCVENSKRSLF